MLTREELQTEFKHRAYSFGLRTDVLGEGPMQAEIVVIGEGPGETEIKTGSPFTGGSGKLLFDTLRRYGLHRANIYVTNVVKRQISLSRVGNEKHIVRRDELNKWLALTEWELGQLPNARIILVMGNYALEAASRMGKPGVLDPGIIHGEAPLTGITNWRGSVIDRILPNGIPGKAVLTINPAYAMRELRLEPVFQMDVHKLNLVWTNSWKEHEVEEIINPTFAESLDFIRDLRAARKPIAFDIETTPQEIACFGLSNDPHLGFCLNLRDFYDNRFSVSEEVDIHLALQELFNDPSTYLIAQNAQFDSYMSWLKNHLRPRVRFDNLLAHHTLYPQLPHSLAFQVAQYTNHPFYKDEGKNWKEGGDINVWWRYNCKDTALTIACAQAEERELRAQGLWEFFIGHVMRAHPHLVQATVHGIRVDPIAKQRSIETSADEVLEAKAEVYRLQDEILNEPTFRPNLGSFQQMRNLWFGRMNLKGRGTSTDETNRDYIVANPQTPPLVKEYITAFDKYKKADKFDSTYANSTVDPDGRFRCEYRQFGTTNAPGRLSSAQTAFGTGGNLQNQPPRAREAFIADPGCVLVYFDLAQAEARVVAYRADIPKWKEQFEQARIDGSFDSHRALASEMFHVPYDEVPKDDFIDGHYTIRYISKRCRHGLNYRMGESRLAEVTGLPFFEARKSFQIYHRLTPQLRQWWKQEELVFKRDRAVYNALGRRFKVIQRIDDEVLESIVAFYPQSTIGDLVTRIWYLCAEDPEWPTEHARIALNVHDNLVGISEPQFAQTCLRVMRRHAEQPIEITDAWGRKTEKLIIPAEVKMSTLERWKTDPITKEKIRLPDDTEHRWSHMKAVKLEEV